MTPIFKLKIYPEILHTFPGVGHVANTYFFLSLVSHLYGNSASATM